MSSVWLSARAVAETLAISAPTLTDSLLGRLTIERSDQRLSRWATRLLDQAEVKREVRGRDRLPAGEVFVVMSNHRSLYDVPLLIESFPGTLRMVAKSELFRVPVWGPAMREAGFIEVDRQDSERARAALDLACARLRQGVNVWIAPEGTRSRSGDLGAFKSGGFRLAMRAGTRILPVAIRGTERVLPADGAAVIPGAQVELTFGEPIDVRSYGLEQRHELSDRVRQTILQMLSGA